MSQQVRGKLFLKFELEELRKQLKEQKYPITIDEGEKNRLETNLLEKKGQMN